VFPALPAGPGLVAVAGGASLHDALEFSSATGVVGMGSPDQNGFPSGRGGVFGSAAGGGSAGNIAQLRLVPTLNPATRVPKVGDFGDLYVTVINDGDAFETGMFLCIKPGDGVNNNAQWTLFQTQGTIQAP
jgi:hypothetical protein